jgi:hypothetical protein
MLIRMRGRGRDERGAVAVTVALVLIVLMGSSAMVFDLARLRHARHVVQAAVDLGALAGAGFLPVQGASEASQAEGTARSIAIANASELEGGGLTIQFGCVVSDPEGNGGADSIDLTFACGPQSGTWGDGWVTKGTRAYHACNPYAGDLCNVIDLRASTTVEYWFAPVIGNDDGSTGALRAVACRGYCGQPSAPLDVMFVLDRTRSMTDADIANVKNAARAVLEFYNPALQWVGLVGLPYHNPSNRCTVASTQSYPAPGVSIWKLVGLSNDYQRYDGSLDPSSELVATLDCLVRAPSGIQVVPNPRSPYQYGHTDIGDPLEAAMNVLLSEGRPDAPDVIVLLTDGEANMPWQSRPCSYATTRATTAKANGVSIFTIAFGADGARCYNDLSGPWTNAYATLFLAAMSGSSAEPPSVDDWPGRCAATENQDDDYYFCTPATSDLEPVFKQIAVAAIQRARLLNV